MNAKRWMIACLIALTLVIYWPVCRYDFVNFDDADYVYNNPHVHAGFCLASMKYAFTTFKVGNWNPLLWISFYTDRLLCGLRPGVMHAENVGLHLLTAFLLWRLWYVCTKQMRTAFMVAALFACHPMHVESVAWISERKDVLSTPLLLGAMLMYVAYCQALKEARRSQWILRYLLMVLLFVLSLMVKSMGVTLPAVLLLLDYWPLRRWPEKSWVKLVLEKLPLLMISAAVAVLVSHSQAWAGAPATLAELSLGVRVKNALVCYAIYIAKLLIPINLAVYYPYNFTRPLGSAIAGGGLLVLTTIIFYRLRRPMPFLIVGWFWFLGTLVPVIGLVQVGGQAMADRYSYLPSIGLFVAGVMGIGSLVQNRQMLFAISAGVLIAFSATAFHQVLQWKDTQTLFTHCVKVTQDNTVAHAELAGVAFEKGDMHLAIDEYHLALQFGENAQAYNGLGNCWLYDDLNRSIGYYHRALEINPNPPSFHVNLANALRMDHRYAEARAEVETALALDPAFPPAKDQLKQIHQSENTTKKTAR